MYVYVQCPPQYIYIYMYISIWYNVKEMQQFVWIRTLSVHLLHAVRTPFENMYTVPTYAYASVIADTDCKR